MRVRARRIWAPGEGEEEDIVIEDERIHSSGQFATVLSAMLVQPRREKIAIKKAWEKTTDSSWRKEDNEVDILSKLNHPNITRLFYYYKSTYETETCHSMILQFLPMDIAKLRAKRYKFDLLDAKLYSYQLLDAIGYLQSQEYAHLDVKPANILVDDDTGILQLADFGNAKKIRESEKVSSYQVTRFYRAPELLFGTTSLNIAIDTWSVACVISELVTGRVLLKEKNKDEQARLVISIFGYPTDAEMKKMKVSRPRFARRTGKGLGILLSDFPILLPLLSRFLVYSPSDRLSPRDALLDQFFSDLFTPTLRSNGASLPCLRKPDSQSIRS